MILSIRKKNHAIVILCNWIIVNIFFSLGLYCGGTKWWEIIAQMIETKKKDFFMGRQKLGRHKSGGILNGIC